MRLIVVGVLLLTGFSALSDQTVIPSYAASKDIFWGQVYPNGNWTIYCGVRFEERGSTVDGQNTSIEHVYPQSWVAEQLGCGTTSECRQNNERFNHAVGDLHNLYPALQNVNSSRGNALLGIIEGEEWRYPDCDYERAPGVAEPRPIARGNLARSIFYMHQEYGFAIPTEMLETLKEWNRVDPPTCHELRRNNTIERIQGTRNRFIDQPHFADDL